MLRFIQSVLFFLFFGVASSIAYADPDPKDPKADPKGDPKPPEVRRIVISRRKEGDPDPTPKLDDDDLNAKVKKQKDEQDKRNSDTRAIESAVSFNMGIDDWVKKNTDILPSDVADIIKVANKETYDTAQLKASALKAAIIQSFFKVQANVDSLTTSQRTTLEDYLKLTNTGKAEKAASIYENILEPALETHRKVKKAEELGRSRGGFSQGNEGQNVYKDKLLKGSRKTYLGLMEA